MAGESAEQAALRMREKAKRLQRSAELWERGAEGERVTAASLENLPAGWTVFHDLRWPGRPFANVDHVAVGPSGVFVIDSKNWSGRIDVVDQVLRQNGRAREKDVHGVAEAALAVAQLSREVTPHQVFPVICFVRDEPVTGWSRDVLLCSTTNVRDLLTTRPSVLDAERVRRLTLELDASFRLATDPRARGRRPGRAGSPSVPQSAPLRQAQPPRRPARRRASGRGALATVLVMGTLLLVLMCSGVPMLLQHVIAGLATPATSEAVPSADAGKRKAVLGRWSGKYICSSTVRSVRLDIKRASGTRTAVTAVFRFGPTPGSAATEHGAFRMTGRATGGELVLEGTKWLKRPPNFSMVDVRAPLPKPRSDWLAGQMPGCSNFMWARDR